MVSRQKGRQIKMKRKQAMKVIAAAGVVIGGAGMFPDGNVVYAAELEQDGDGGSDELVFSASEKADSSEETRTAESDIASAAPHSEEVRESSAYTEQDSGQIQEDSGIDNAESVGSNVAGGRYRGLLG